MAAAASLKRHFLLLCTYRVEQFRNNTRLLSVNQVLSPRSFQGTVLNLRGNLHFLTYHLERQKQTEAPLSHAVNSEARTGHFPTWVPETRASCCLQL